jgi:hypothetical protein
MAWVAWATVVMAAIKKRVSKELSSKRRARASPELGRKEKMLSTCA